MMTNESPSSQARRWRGCLALGLAVLAVSLAWPTAARGQSGTQAIRYQGTLSIGNSPAPAGTEITVISDQNVSSPTVCGSTTVSGSDGSYSVDIAPLPDTCVQRISSQGPSPRHIFLVKGENVRDLTPNGPPRLDRPESLGQTEQVNLFATAIPNLTWTGSAGDALIAIRYYGTLSIGNTLAPQGTQITVMSDQGSSSPTVCGSATVNDQFGRYYLDIAPIPDTCVQRLSSEGPSPRHIFLVKGENVRDLTPNGPPRLDRPESLAHTEQVNLVATAIPNLTWTGSAGDPLIAIRYYGTLYYGNTPAPRGALITVVSDQTAGSPATCGSATVNDQFGHYYLDISPLPDTCVQRVSSRGPSPRHIFYARGENVRDLTPNGPPRLDQPATLAHTEQVNLIGSDADPAPSVSELSQTSATAGGPDFSLIITGTGFVEDTRVEGNGRPLSATVASPFRLRATVPKADLATEGTIAIVVINPPPRGGRSAPFNLIVRAAPGSTSTSTPPPTLTPTPTAIATSSPGATSPPGPTATPSPTSSPAACVSGLLAARGAAAVPPKRRVEGLGWQMEAEVSPREGLMVRDVKLDDRYMAVQMSVPYLVLQTSTLSARRLELTPDSAVDAVGASRLTGFDVVLDAKLTVSATYEIRNITKDSCTSVLLTQEYVFEPKQDPKGNPELGCEASSKLSCARFRPLVRYQVLGQGGPEFFINVAQRLHLAPDRRAGRPLESENQTGALFKDCESPPDLPPLFCIRSLNPIFETRLNPLGSEMFPRVIDNGVKDAFDNYHQTSERDLSEPGPGGAGCPRCVHIHWRWGSITKFAPDSWLSAIPLFPTTLGTRFFTVNGSGRPIVPAGSNQMVRVAVVRYQPGEERPIDVGDIAKGEPLTPQNGRVPLVFWYSATGFLPKDTFFQHGGFFSPLTTTPAGSKVAVQPLDETTGQTPATLAFDTVTQPGTTSLSLASAGPPLPAGLTLGDPKTYYLVDTTSEFTGPIDVCFKYSGTAYRDPTALRLFHYGTGGWEDQTVSLDTANSTICGRTGTLSPFAIVEPDQPRVYLPTVLRVSGSSGW